MDEWDAQLRERPGGKPRRRSSDGRNSESSARSRTRRSPASSRSTRKRTSLSQTMNEARVHPRSRRVGLPARRLSSARPHRRVTPRRPRRQPRLLRSGVAFLPRAAPRYSLASCARPLLDFLELGTIESEALALLDDVVERRARARDFIDDVTKAVLDQVANLAYECRPARPRRCSARRRSSGQSPSGWHPALAHPLRAAPRFPERTSPKSRFCLISARVKSC